MTTEYVNEPICEDSILVERDKYLQAKRNEEYNRKGYNYERQIWDILNSSGIDYEGNPIIFRLWNRFTIKGYDVRAYTHRKGWVKVECRFTSKPIYHSWFVRDWFHKLHTADIIVTNNKFHIPYQDRQTIREYGVKLFNTNEFCNYMLKQNKRRHLLYKYVIFGYGSFGSFCSKLRERVEQRHKIRLKIRLRDLSNRSSFMFGLNDNMFKGGIQI